jgi:hypothetical protein
LTISGVGTNIHAMSSVIHIRGSHRRARRKRWTAKRLFQGLRAAWRRIFAHVIPNFPPDSPEPSPPLAKAEALREGALLSDYIDARSEGRVA